MSSSTAKRQRWLGLLARAERRELAGLWEALSEAPVYTVLRPAETGLVMVRGRAGGTGQRFNLGEMTVTRAAVRLDDGTVGHGYVAGRERRSAEYIAVYDALLQAGLHIDPIRNLLDAIAARRQEARRNRARKAAATKVDFSTLAREVS